MKTFSDKKKSAIKKVAQSLPGTNDLIEKPSLKDALALEEAKAGGNVVDLDEVDVKTQMLREANTGTRTPGKALDFESLEFNPEHGTVKAWAKKRKISLQQAQNEFDMENNALESPSLDLSVENVNPRATPSGYVKARARASTKADKLTVDVIALAYKWNLPPNAVLKWADELGDIDAKKGESVFDVIQSSDLRSDFFKIYQRCRFDEYDTITVY